MRPRRPTLDRAARGASARAARRRPGRALLDLRLRPGRPAHRGHAGRGRERPVRRLLQPRCARAAREAALRGGPDLGRAREHRRPRRGGRRPERRPARLRHRALDARGARGQPRGRQPLRLRVPVAPRLGLGPRLQRRQRLGSAARRPAPASAASGSASSSTGSGEPGRTGSPTGSRSAFRRSSPIAPSAAGARCRSRRSRAAGRGPPSSEASTSTTTRGCSPRPGSPGDRDAGSSG